MFTLKELETRRTKSEGGVACPGFSKVGVESQAFAQGWTYTSGATNFLMVAMHFLIYKGFSEKYKGKYAIIPFLISFLVGRLNQVNSFAIMLHFYCCFRRHSYRRHFMPYGNMVSEVDNRGIFGSSNTNATI
jgi:hypothetical protein